MLNGAWAMSPSYTPALRSAIWFGAESNATSLIAPFLLAALIAEAAPFAAVSCVAYTPARSGLALIAAVTASAALAWSVPG